MANDIRVEHNYGGIHNYERVARNPSYLADIVNKMSLLPFDHSPDVSSVLPFEIDNKLDYNNVIIYKQIVEDYAFYSALINDAYIAIAEIKPNCRDTVMRIINREYRKIRASLLINVDSHDMMSVIKLNSDSIIENVLKILKEKLFEANNLNSELHNETIDIAIEMIVGDAFINCKILENPSAN